jgi:hypothetical protein
MAFKGEVGGGGFIFVSMARRLTGSPVILHLQEKVAAPSPRPLAPSRFVPNELVVTVMSGIAAGVGLFVRRFLRGV